MIIRHLLADAMPPEYTMQHRLRIDEILPEDLVEGGNGETEVFGDQVGIHAGGEGAAGIGEGGGGFKEGLVMALICYKGRIATIEKIRFQGDQRRTQLGKAKEPLKSRIYYNRT